MKGDVAMSSSSPTQLPLPSSKSRQEPGTACRELASGMQRVLRGWLDIAAQEKVFNARENQSAQCGAALPPPSWRKELGG